MYVKLLEHLKMLGNIYAIDIVKDYAEYFIVAAMLGVLSIWWINQFDGGYY